MLKPYPAAKWLAATMLMTMSVHSFAYAAETEPAPTTAAQGDAAALQNSPPATPLGKLTDAVGPLHYKIDLTLDANQPRFSGVVDIDVTLKAPSRFIHLHGNEFTMHKVSARVAGREIAGEYKQVDDTGVALLTFPEILPEGPASLHFEYDGAFHEGPTGLFRVNVDGKWYSWSQFESTDARAAIPSFDEPGFKQPFSVTIRTPKDIMAVSNAPETRVERQGDWDIHHFADTVPLPTYLLAIMTGPFVSIGKDMPPNALRKKPLPLRIIMTQPNAGKMDFALAEAPKIVELLEEYFGQSFPYPKLDLIGSPIMPGAMENAGADLFDDGLLALDKHASTYAMSGFGMVVAHELGHQWFGDLVSPAWWDDIWLNESFANWMGFRIGHAWRPELQIGDGAKGSGFSAMHTDALLAGRPIHQKIEKTTQIDAAFDGITYGKGGHVVSMFASYMGDEKFKSGVRRYMAAHEHANATTNDFFSAMAEVSGDPRILTAMQSFTDQQGVPVLTFTRSNNGAGSTWNISQSRYVRYGTKAPETLWGVPVCARLGTEQQCTLLDKKEGSISFSGKFGDQKVFMPNDEGNGYYRFDLPEEEWNALIAKADSLPGGEALALADSLQASFTAGHAKASQLLALAQNLSKNPDSNAAGVAIDGLASLKGGELLDSAAAKSYKAFVARIYAPLLAKIGFDPRLGAHAADDPDVISRRGTLVSNMTDIAEDPQINAQFVQAANLWLSGDETALDPMWYGSAFSAWLKKEGLPGAKTLLEKALSSEDANLRPSILYSLSGSGNLKIAQWLLNDVQDKRLRYSERTDIMMSIAATRKTRAYGYGWLLKRRDTMLAKQGNGIFLASKLPYALGNACSAKAADRLESDFGTMIRASSGALDFERVLEGMRSCDALKQARRKEVSADIAKLAK